MPTSRSHPAWPNSPYYRIDLPKIPAQYEAESLLAVLPDSPLLLRQEVERFAYYFRREFRYDWIPFHADEAEAADGIERSEFKDRDKPYTAYLFADDEQRMEDDFTESGLVWVGAGCFHWRKCEELDGVPIEEFSWAWLHPYFRGRRILGNHWELGGAAQKTWRFFSAVSAVA